jgi:hypothetical protein
MAMWTLSTCILSWGDGVWLRLQNLGAARSCIPLPAILAWVDGVWLQDLGAARSCRPLSAVSSWGDEVWLRLQGLGAEHTSCSPASH